MSPFFSPKGEWIGFFAGTVLKKVSITGGAAIPICEALTGRGGTWTDDDEIIFTPAASQPTKLMRVSANGGTPVEFGTFLEGGTTQRWPQALPGNRAVLYTEHDFGSMFDAANLVVAPLAGGAPKVVVRGGYYGRYLAGPGSPKRGAREGGHLLYIQQGSLFAVPFDLERLETTGQAKPVLEGVAATSEFGSAHFATADDGTLVYVPGTASEGMIPIDWMTSDGKTSVLASHESRWSDPAFSPDGKYLAMVINDGRQRDIWVYELASDTVRQLTFDASNERSPVWAPDSQSIAFSSDKGSKGVLNLYVVKADGNGEPTRLTDSPNLQQASSWHRDFRYLAFHEARGATELDLMMLPMEGDAASGWKPGTPTVFLATPAREAAPMFSPDGRWLAFSVRTGASSDIFVRSFPDVGGQRRVSGSDGGVWPQWSRTSPELLFAGPRGVMVAPYLITGNSFTPGKVRNWSPIGYVALTGNSHPFALHPDGKRIALRALTETPTRDKVVFVSNFFDYLRALAPGK
jgi:serine/threonine-protein kinase